MITTPTGVALDQRPAPASTPARRRRPSLSLVNRIKQRRAVLVAAGLGLAGLLAVLIVFEFVIVDLIHSTRHDHLIADFNSRDRPVGDSGEGGSKIPSGGGLAILQIPKIELNEIVIEGDSAGNLRAGPGHRSTTPLPGTPGNSVVLGHAVRYGGPFRGLQNLRKGDEIFVQVANQPAARYVVAWSRRVGSSDTGALGRSKETRLTLVTSAGGRLSTDRRVVVAVAEEKDDGKVRGFGGSFNPGRPSPLFNGALGLAYLALLGAWAEARWLRVRHRLVVVAMAVLPLLVLGTLLVLLNLDLLLPATT